MNVTVEEYESKRCSEWSVKDLRVICKRRGLKMTGTKQELCKRLEDDYQYKRNRTIVLDLFNSEDQILSLIKGAIENDDVERIAEICIRDKNTKSICDRNKEAIKLLVLERYDVDYLNPDNLIYNGKYKAEDLNVNRAFKSFMKYYYKELINLRYELDPHYQPIKSTNSIPSLPKLKKLFLTVPVQVNTAIPLLNPVLPRFASLVELHCGQCELTGLQSMPQLRILKCGWNKLTSLPDLPNLKVLDCGGNRLTTLPVFPKLVELDCVKNNLINLPSMPKLKTLHCGDNNLESLPESPNLVNLRCQHNKLTHILGYPLLKTLYCHDNVITTIEQLPEVKIIDCSHNNLSELPNFPNLQDLNCNFNALTTLPELLPNLVRLKCNANLLQGVPAYPKLKKRNISYGTQRNT